MVLPGFYILFHIVYTLNSTLNYLFRPIPVLGTTRCKLRIKTSVVFVRVKTSFRSSLKSDVLDN